MSNPELFTKGYALLQKEGSVSRPLILLFHGITGAPEEMLPLGRHLYEHRGFNVLVPCFSGHGHSIDELKLTPACSWLSDMETSFQEALKYSPSQFLVGGLSFGSLLALILAGQYPERINGLIALAPPVRLGSLPKEILLQALSRCSDAFLNSLGTVKKKHRSEAVFIEGRVAFDSHSVAGAARTVYLRRLALQLAPQVRCPVLAIQDPTDHHLSVEGLLTLRSCLCKTTFTQRFLPGGQHELTIGPRVKDMLELVDRFLDDNLLGIG